MGGVLCIPSRRLMCAARAKVVWCVVVVVLQPWSQQQVCVCMCRVAQHLLLWFFCVCLHTESTGAGLFL